MSETRPGAAGGGLLASLRRLAATALELAQVRLELIGVELEEQKERIVWAVVLVMMGLMLLCVGVLLLAGCVVLMFQEGHRLAAMAVLTLLFLGGGALVLRHAIARLKTPGGAFAASVAELAQDRSALTPRADAGPRLP